MKNSRLLKRQEEILRILAENESVSVRELIDKLGVSGWTVRRDLERMAAEGVVWRQYGLVALTAPLSLPAFDSFEQRSRENLAAKQRIGLAAARLLKANQSLALGAGTTTTQVARELSRLNHKPLHIMTNALNIALELAHQPNLQVTCTGGDVRRDHFTLTGPVAERALRAHFYDVAVIGVSGITLKEGLTVNGQLDAVALEIMIEQSRRLVVVADSSKIGQVHFVHLAPLSRADVLVTDRRPANEFCDGLANAAVELVLPDSIV
ncbi:MAG: HTH-type transcriptional repressor GlcR [Anaerolineae bacterium]|nr:HTH-type transcriptional repressor GlcR [Anaerolineae bacterium]